MDGIIQSGCTPFFHRTTTTFCCLKAVSIFHCIVDLLCREAALQGRLESAVGVVVWDGRVYVLPYVVQDPSPVFEIFPMITISKGKTNGAYYGSAESTDLSK